MATLHVQGGDARRRVANTHKFSTHVRAAHLPPGAAILMDQLMPHSLWAPSSFEKAFPPLDLAHMWLSERLTASRPPVGSRVARRAGAAELKACVRFCLR